MWLLCDFCGIWLFSFYFLSLVFSHFLPLSISLPISGSLNSSHALPLSLRLPPSPPLSLLGRLRRSNMVNGVRLCLSVRVRAAEPSSCLTASRLPLASNWAVTRTRRSNEILNAVCLWSNAPCANYSREGRTGGGRGEGKRTRGLWGAIDGGNSPLPTKPSSFPVSVQYIKLYFILYSLTPKVGQGLSSF